jgi:hypothetical protein
MTAYVVAISHRYKVVSHHSDIREAMAEAIRKSVISFCWVVRDGETGKRYSMGQCRQINRGRK